MTLRRSAAILGLAGVLCGLAPACGSSSTTTNPTGITLITPTVADQAIFIDGFMTEWRLDNRCPVVVVPNLLRGATDSSGVSWAHVQFLPAATCSLPQGGGQFADPLTRPPFHGINNPPGITFQKAPNGPWRYNGSSGDPFPCPDPKGIAPGPGTGAFPKEILAAWGFTYAAHCDQVIYDRVRG